MSSSSQKGSLFDDSSLTLSLFKISYTSSATIQGKFTWTHLPQRDNIFAVFDGLDGPAYGASSQAGRVLKLIQNSDVLSNTVQLEVEISLDDLLYQVRQDDEKARSQAYADKNRSVLIAIKRPLVALRYQAPNGQVRRIQVNFLPVEGYDQAVGIFRRIGLPIDDRNQTSDPQLPTRPSLSSIKSNPSAQFTGVMRSESSDLRESIGQDHDNPYVMRETLAHGLHRPTSQSIGDTYHSLYHPPENVRPPSSTNFFESNLIGCQNHSRQQPARADPTVHDLVSDSLISSSTLAGNDIASRTDSGRSSVLLPSFEFVPRLTEAPPFLSSSSGKQADLPRPSTAPLMLTQMLPPKRELPFPKRPLTATSLEPDSQPPPSSDPIAALPPRRILPFTKSKKPFNVPPTSSPNITASPLREASSSAPAPSKKKPKAKSPKGKFKAQPRKGKGQKAANSVFEIFTETIAKTANILETKPSTESTADTRTTSASDTTNQVPPLVQPTEPLSTVPQLNQPIAQPNPLNQPPSIPPLTASLFSSLTPENYLSRLDFLVRAYHKLPAPQAPKRTSISEDLATYAAQSEDERMKFIDDAICDCLEDENFGRLCEDVERSWRRIGLGF